MIKEGIKRYKLKISIFLLSNIIFSKSPPEFILFILCFTSKRLNGKIKKAEIIKMTELNITVQNKMKHFSFV